ncbi:Chaperone tailless complex polypeptide 1 (TCP-1),T-complex protein 1, theta subunit,GroEL-like [Cinara cedri]|uniref:T-complex protein 1 subunit theta n=1 Tax=Cinara cedri TaxID=506608 RepID=A0A5E4NG23_9HEMI|nr:Chaperone tailless complex polypeptide 1 (TCP-1),T-complex protein 1, theta subunit,GroEL-like [Cinara cedri]
MALHVPKAPGFQQMLKDGAMHLSGLEEAVYRNIAACKQFSDTVKTAYGPNGMNKIVINHIDKLFITNDAATIVKELDIEHPAAKIIVFASEIQEQEVGDGTNFVVIFAGALLEQAEHLLKMGLTPVEVCEGFQIALEKTLELLPTLTYHEIKDIKNNAEQQVIMQAVKSSIMSKQYGQEQFITDLVLKACSSILPEKTTFNVDNIRVCKILGSNLYNSSVVNGMVFKRTNEGDITKQTNAKIAVYTCPIDITTTETKGTVLIKSADELQNFSRGEEMVLEEQIKAIADAGVTVIVASGKFGDMALHYLNKYKIMGVRLMSKFDLRRLCKSVSATALPRLTPPNKEEIGYADCVYVDELGDTSLVVFRLDGKDSRMSTIVVRGATDNYMDDIERAIDDGVNTFKGITRDGRLLPGAGAIEMELAYQVGLYADTLPGLEQYGAKRFANALEGFIKILADNTGVKSNETLAELYSQHSKGNKNAGFNIEPKGSSLIDSTKAGIFDSYLSKFWGLQYATQAACTILKVDQIIMAKRAGGPQAPGGRAPDNDDDA